MLENCNCTNKIHTITADNALTNNKMARELSKLIPQFDVDSHLLGCVAHVINLGAQAGLGVLGTIDDNDRKETSMADSDSTAGSGSTNVMSISTITSDPDGIGLNMQTVLKRVHGLCKYV